EPKSYLQASKDANWTDAMKQELQALDDNHTWELTTLPPDKKTIGQMASSSWPIFQLDINNINGIGDEDVYMDPPEGYVAALPGQVYDILIIGTSATISKVKTYLHELFTIKDLGEAKYFLGLELPCSDHGFHKFSQNAGALLASPDRYRHLVGRLLYLGFTCPNISFAVQQLSTYLQSPCSSHWDAELHVLRYLKGTPSSGLFFLSVNDFQLSAFFVAAWVSCVDSRRSITRYCVFLGSCLISWKTKKQATPIPFWCNNKANPVFHERTKHLDIDCHLVRDQFKLDFINPSYVPGSCQLDDLFTKSPSIGDFSRLLSKMGLLPPTPS
ncbi:UNVERIFIED_CONTAM: hypothetical protein Sangu_0157500, partial [Sesamum angustifolium]